jgi:hypothetical protein
MRRCIGSLLVIGALMGTVGCAGPVRIYDDPYRDYHHWDTREDRAYRKYLREQPVSPGRRRSVSARLLRLQLPRREALGRW